MPSVEFVQGTVFSAGQDGYHTYRIPALVRSTAGTLLAFSEGRKTSAADDGDIDIVLKRSTNGGASWQPLRLVQEEGGSAPITIGNPAPVVDEVTGRIHLLFCRNNSRVYHTWSDDDGLTWSNRREITASVKRPEWGWYATGPGHGIQLRRGAQAGRLVVPSDHNPSSGGNGAHVVYSDDGGTTWRIGASFDGIGAGVRPNENLAVELVGTAPGNNSRLYFNAREQGSGTPGNRAVAWSNDGGSSYAGGFTATTAFTAPMVQGSLLRLRATDQGDPGNRILFSTPNHADSRVNLSLWSSSNEGQSWGIPRSVYSGPSAYSDMALISAGRIGLLFENGRSGPYQRITLARFNEEWLDTPTVLDVDFEHWQGRIGDPDGANDGDRVQDRSGNGFHGFWGGGPAANGTPIIAAPGGTGVDTTRTDGHVILRGGLPGIPADWDGGTVTRPAYFTLPSARSFTFEAMLNWRGNGHARDGIMGQVAAETAGQTEWWIREDGGRLEYVFDDGPDRVTGGASIAAGIANNDWHHVAVVLDRSADQIRTYLDYQLVATDANPVIARLGHIGDGFADIRLGAYNATAAHRFKGWQDRYRVTVRALVPTAFFGHTALTLAATPFSSGQIDLSWANVLGESGYRIERSPNGSSGWTQIAQVGANVTTYADTADLALGTRYYYRVRPFYAVTGNGAYSPTASAATLALGSFTITATPATVTAGEGFSLTVTARDTAGNRAVNYRGTVTFTTTDPLGGALPPDTAFTAADAGVRTFAEIGLYTVGAQRITVSDLADPAARGARDYTVNPGPLAFYYFDPGSELSTSVPVGVPLTFYVYPFDAYGNLLTDYAGTVAFWSPDPRADYPMTYTFTGTEGGIGTPGTVTFGTLGIQEFFAWDACCFTSLGYAAYDVTAGLAPGGGSAPRSSDLVERASEAERWKDLGWKVALDRAPLPALAVANLEQLLSRPDASDPWKILGDQVWQRVRLAVDDPWALLLGDGFCPFIGCLVQGGP